MSLYHGDNKVGEGRIKTQPGQFSRPKGCVSAVTAARRSQTTIRTSPHRFTGGTIKRVIVDVSGEPNLDSKAKRRRC